MDLEQIKRIQLLIERRRFDEAHQRIVETLSQSPDSGYLYALQAEIHERQDEHVKALSAIETAIGLDPESDYMFFIKSQIHVSLNQNKKAMEAIDMALQLDNEDADHYGQKAYIFFKMDEREKAIAWARKGKELDPENLLCSNILSHALGSLGNTSEAESVLGTLLEKDPDNEFTHSSMGYNYLRKGNIAKAKEHFSAALTIDPEHEPAREGMIEAIKATNFFYRKVLEYSIWMQKMSEGKQWMFLIGLVVVVRVFLFLLPFYMIFVLWVWFARPISNAILYFDKFGRYLMSGQMRLATQINIGLLVVSLLSVAVFTPLLGVGGLGLAAACFVSIIPIHRFVELEVKRNKLVMALFACTFLLSGVAGFVMSLIGMPNDLTWTALLLSTVAFTWVANLFND
ncbi:MAG: tetratricopeptide repeat protein [Flavobacteriales bacterium]|nr:tetratricopeptide repeat protein [Flavobacteriales bacterium]